MIPAPKEMISWGVWEHGVDTMWLPCFKKANQTLPGGPQFDNHDNQTNKQTNNQASKQTNKQTNKQLKTN